MVKKKTTIVSVLLFVVVFAALLTTATFTDLQVSNILTHSALASHEYITNDTFGAMFESVGSMPVYFMIAFGFEILFWAVVRKNKEGKFFQNIIAFGLAVAALVTNVILFNDTINYLMKHFFGTDNESALPQGGYIIGSVVFIAVIVTFFEIMAVNNFSDESIEKLVRFAFAAIAAAAVSIILVELVKKPVGRIRYRAMNLDPDNEIHGFGAFAKWFEINGAKWKELYPTHEAKIAELGTKDAFKSFPSGHTNGAGGSYYLIMLIPALGIKKKWQKVLLWICPVIFTGIVAVSRIVVGAHFFSDVLVGGTNAFLWMIVMREIFIFKGEHLKVLFGKNK